LDVHSLSIDCTGDVLAGDVIRFTDIIWGGSRTRPVRTGERLIVARVLGQSTAGVRKHHVFTMEVLHSSGLTPIEPGKTIVRKSRNVYRNGAYRAERQSEQLGESVVEASAKPHPSAHADATRVSRRSISAPL
jgi:hypothetical protein